MNTSEVILVLVNSQYGFDADMTMTFTSSEKADEYAAEIIKKLSWDIDDLDIDDEIDDYLDDGYWESNKNESINVTISSITHHAE